MPHEHGAILIGSMQVASTLMCPHCGVHFELRPGSGKRRTFCGRCRAVTCGAHACDPCIPLEARLDHAEGRKTRYDELIRTLLAEGAAIL